MTTGPRLLSQHLSTRKLSLRDFAARVGTCASNVQKWRRGESSPGVDFALAIEKATKGAVPVKAWRKDA